MKLQITEAQMREAVVSYINLQGILANCVVKPEHVSVNLAYQHDEAELVGITIDLEKAKIVKKEK